METNSPTVAEEEPLVLTADDLFRRLFISDEEENRKLLLIGGLPEVQYRKFPLEKFPVHNPTKRTIKNCEVWVAEGQDAALADFIKFNILENIADCRFYFFRIPLKGSKLVFDLKGNGHKAVCLSKQRMGIFCRLIRKNSTFVVGEGVHIGGCKLALDETIVRIGAGGLWSDGILVQGTDSHGIVDIETMQIINQGPKYIRFGRRVWIGRDVKIMKNVSIDDGSVVGTGAMVTKSIPKACVAVGFPAKVVRSRTSWSGKPDTVSSFEAKEIAMLRESLEFPAYTETQTATESVGFPFMANRLKDFFRSNLIKLIGAGAVGALFAEGVESMAVFF